MENSKKGVRRRITLNKGGGYKVRATRKSVGTFDVVAIDWEHPNYGYFADAGLWIRSPHMGAWELIPVVNWMEKYDTIESFLSDYPIFSELFEQVDPYRDSKGD